MAELTAPDDEAMPQLRTLWNATAMGAVLDRALCPTDGRGARIRGCRIERVRYRVGERSIVLYELDVEEPGGGRRRIWASASTYPDARGEAHCRRLAGAAAAIPTALLPLAATAYLPLLRTLVQVFPLDRHLPSLPALFRDHAELRALVTAGFAPGAWRIVAWSAEPVRYRPSVGAVLRIVIEAEAGRERASCVVFAKAYRDDEGRLAHERLQAFYEACRCRAERFSPVRPLGWAPSLRVLVLAEAPGRSLESLLLAGERDPVLKAFESTAVALADLHRSPLPGGQRQGSAEMLEQAARALRFIALAVPGLQRKVHDVLDALSRQLVDVAPAPTHFDIKPEHVFVDGEHVTFIDLDSLAEGDPMFDPAMLVARLRVLPALLPVPAVLVECAITRFLDCYQGAVPQAWSVRLPVQFACATLKVALYFVQHAAGDWQTMAIRLVDDAANALRERRIPGVAGGFAPAVWANPPFPHVPVRQQAAQA